MTSIRTLCAGAIVACVMAGTPVAGLAAWEVVSGKGSLSAENGSSVLKYELAPGDDIKAERHGEPATPVDMPIRMTVSAANVSSRDYDIGDAVFPVAVTVAFGEESQKIGWRTRLKAYFANIFRGFPPDGIRLTYVFGNRAPVGSMYRIDEEETVFVIAGPEDANRTVESVRNLSADFEAAYARLPKGKVTEMLVRGERPSKENGPVAVTIVLDGPLAR